MTPEAQEKIKQEYKYSYRKEQLQAAATFGFHLRDGEVAALKERIAELERLAAPNISDHYDERDEDDESYDYDEDDERDPLEDEFNECHCGAIIVDPKTGKIIKVADCCC